MQHLKTVLTLARSAIYGLSLDGLTYRLGGFLHLERSLHRQYPGDWMPSIGKNNPESRESKERTDSAPVRQLDK